MKNNTPYILFLLFLFVIYVGSVINQEIAAEQISKKNKQISIPQEDNEDIYYHNLVYEEVPLTKNETSELAKYREDLVQWYKWDNECMGMDPNSKPKDPRLKQGK